MIYAGIGSRDITTEALNLITKISTKLDARGFSLRSGGATGADTAFEKGSSKPEIFKAKHATPTAIELASKYHPAWSACTDYARSLHGRNMMIVLGADLKTPVNFVVCWTRDETRGGTSMGIRVAREHNIPVYNLYRKEDLEQLVKDVTFGLYSPCMKRSDAGILPKAAECDLTLHRL